MVRFIGMQKGRTPDRDVDEEFHSVLRMLRKKHSFEHMDSSHGCNCILVPDGEGKEKLLIIDLEWCEQI